MVLSSQLVQKVEELNNGYNPEDCSIGRFALMIANPYGLYPGISLSLKKEMVEHVRHNLSVQSLDVAHYFIRDLFKAKYQNNNKYGLKLNLPRIQDPSFHDINTYGDLLNDLILMRKSTTSRCAKDNIDNFRKSPNSGIFRDRLEEKLIMKSWEPKKGPVGRVSFRTKSRDSFVNKCLERFIRFDREIFQNDFYIENLNSNVSGEEIFRDYFRKFRNSGMDLYDFFNKENPIYLQGDDLKKFKDKFIALFPIDHDGGKIIVETKDDAKYLAEDILNKAQYLDYPIHLRLCEDNVKEECKDGSYTLGVGGLARDSDITEIKIQYSAAAIESEFGSNMHLRYKFKIEDKLKQYLKENKNYLEVYKNLCKAFRIDTRLL